MEHYIDKDALVAEIKKLEKMYCYDNKTNSGLVVISVFENINNVIDTLEVKEVDLDKECRKYLTEHFNVYEDGILQSKRSGMPLDTFDVIQVAKHFFELGLKAQKGE